jgi:hypothetical protein
VYLHLIHKKPSVILVVTVRTQKHMFLQTCRLVAPSGTQNLTVQQVKWGVQLIGLYVPHVLPEGILENALPSTLHIHSFLPPLSLSHIFRLSDINDQV